MASEWSHVIIATYTGNASFTGSSATLTQTVSLASTGTALSSSLNPSLVGHSVTFSATVTSTSGTPAGIVTFTNNRTPLGTATLNAGGVATITVEFGHTGSHTIVAQYGGSASFAASGSTALTQVVNP